ncbi:flagellar biosynthetic protein FlhB [Rhodovulum imhoffii]|uniref:Flagellar biosynthetic protein FlhB n=1 Tax=Rhodovulum imhoffii TaxID=365340 RepID=A0A2T5BRP9_9RHOB|nr:flagellar type III secretion system protein FlhB [Rhodovulum imhoffii]MBK5934077.1 flagellar biosynthesis protein FlhB [Rhodovulum imhoffii]PTN01962.1 flagellar biosynthetic protein FlhB [Rhodovulum imhoffii]
MSETAEKPHEPTPKKLDQARRKGEVARSTDLHTAASYAGLVLVALALGASGFVGFGSIGMVLLDRAPTFAPLLLEDGGRAPAGGLILALGGGLVPWFLVPAVAVLVSVIAQRAFVVAPDKIKPKASRLNPVQTARQKFGPSGLFEFAKSAAKLVIYSVLLGVYIFARIDEILATPRLPPAPASSAMMHLAVEFLMVAVVIASAIGAIDFFWQAFDHRRKNRMSHQELKDEIKESEGDPHMKQQRRQKGMDIATNRMLNDVPSANVVIVNPNHYAVALKWSQDMPGAPVCVAKGVDEIAARIRETAASAGVPVHRDVPTARALHATVEIGQEVPPDQYRPVAAAIRFAEDMRQRARSRS